MRARRGFLAVLVLTIAVTAASCAGPTAPTLTASGVPTAVAMGWACGVSAVSGTGQATGVVVDTELRPIAGARVRNNVLNGGAGCRADAAGVFAFTYPLSAVANVQVVAEGFNTREVAWRRGDATTVLRVVMQQTVVVSRGERLVMSLSENDLGYYVGEAYDSDYCFPCKEMTISGAASEARLQWTGDAVLAMWSSSGSLLWRAQPDGAHAMTVEAARASRIYVGLPLGADRERQHLAEPTSFEISLR